MNLRRLAARTCAAATALTCAAAAHAHAGHGAVTEWHWHATDSAGFVLVVVLAGLAVWLSRKD
jgi:hypothetical protein